MPEAWRALAAATLLAFAPAVMAEAKLPALGDLGAAARAAGAGEPVIVLVTTRGCAHCKQVREAYLRPRATAGAVVREIDLTGRESVTDASGRRDTEAGLARRLGVRVAPTVVLLDGQGRPLATPLEGSDTAGFYEAYLDARLAEARVRLSNNAP